MVTVEQVQNALKECYDPEIPVNIFELGLIYDVQIQDDTVKVKMTLTSQGCPSAQQIPDQARAKILEMEGVKDAAVEVVWDPPWDPSRMSEEAKKQLGIG